MKTTYIHLLCLLILSSMFTETISAQQTGQSVKKASDAYIFPIQPGTPEWKAIGSYFDRVNACQIPEHLLKQMSTEGLIDTCLAYPFFFNMMAFNDLNDGFEAVTSSFNGLQELLIRPDAPEKLLKRYSGLKPERFDTTWTPVQKAEYGLSFVYIESILAQEPILSRFNTQEHMLLLQKSVQQFHAKQRHPDIYGGPFSFFMGKLIQRTLERVSPDLLKQRLTQHNDASEFFMDMKLLQGLVSTAEHVLANQEKEK